MLETLLALAPQQTFLVAGNAETFDALIREAATSSLVYTKAPQLTIEEAKNIARFASEGTFEKTVGIFYFASYSNGAAEVLLKALEEPHKEVTVIIVTPHPYTFPQTLRSRMRVIPRAESDTTPSTRSQLIKIGTQLALSTDDATVRREETISFIDMFEQYAHRERDLTLAETLFDAKKFLLKANLPPKQVLEYVLSNMI